MAQGSESGSVLEVELRGLAGELGAGVEEGEARDGSRFLADRRSAGDSVFSLMAG